MTNDDRSCPHPGDGLMHVCRAIASELDAPPPEVIAGAVAAFSWRTLDIELADLLLSERRPCISEPLARS